MAKNYNRKRFVDSKIGGLDTEEREPYLLMKHKIATG